MLTLAARKARRSSNAAHHPGVLEQGAELSSVTVGLRAEDRARSFDCARGPASLRMTQKGSSHSKNSQTLIGASLPLLSS